MIFELKWNVSVKIMDKTVITRRGLIEAEWRIYASVN